MLIASLIRELILTILNSDTYSIRRGGIDLSREYTFCDENFLQVGNRVGKIIYVIK